MANSLDRYAPIFRQLDPRLQPWHEELTRQISDLQKKVGTQGPKFIDSGQPLATTQPTPVAINVTATGGTYQVSVVTPQDIQPASPTLARAKILKGGNAILTPLYHNIQSAEDTNFNSASNVVDYGSTPQTKVAIPAPGQTLYWRIRSSFDGKNWNAWQIFSGPAGPVAVSS